MGMWVKVGGSADLRISRADKLAHQNKKAKKAQSHSEKGLRMRESADNEESAQQCPRKQSNTKRIFT